MFITVNKKQVGQLALYALLISISIYYYSRLALPTFGVASNQKVIVIDAGHGGWDPGKTGSQGDNEKDINLKIADNLQTYLESSGAFVVITRNTDDALSDSKRGDLNARKTITNESHADVIISIHQNSFPKPGVSGAQVFYHKNSVLGEKLALMIQESLISFADPNNRRIAKPNTNYYILKNTEIPAVIVECGFLSNPQEEAKLNEEDYQERIAWAIYVGINEYFNEPDTQQ